MSSVTTDLPWMLIGGGGHARSVYDVLQRKGERLLGLLADSCRPEWLPGTCIALPTAELSEFRESAQWVVAIGHPAARERLTAVLMALGKPVGTLVAETATVSVDAKIGQGAMLMEHTHVGPGVEVGVGAIINTGAVLEHECCVGDFAHVAPSAVLLGGAVVGDRVLVGAGAVVLPAVRVGQDSTIGAQSVVTRAVGASATIRGVPARQRNIGDPGRGGA